MIPKIIHFQNGHLAIVMRLRSFWDYDGKPEFYAGVSFMFAILESVSMWNGTKSQLVSCLKQEKLYFGIMDVEGLTDELAVRSSDGSLPNPRTRGNNSVMMLSMI
jgi:hypothetical protein